MKICVLSPELCLGLDKMTWGLGDWPAESSVVLEFIFRWRPVALKKTSDHMQSYYIQYI